VLRINSNFEAGLEDVDEDHEKSFSALAAQERAQRIASLVGSHSAPTSARTSLDEDAEDGYAALRPSNGGGFPVRIDDIPLVDMHTSKTYDGAGFDIDEDDLEKGNKKPPKVSTTTEAHKLVRAHTRKHGSGSWMRRQKESQPGLVSGQTTPTEEQTSTEYIPRPQQYRGGVLSSLLKLYNSPNPGSRATSRRGSTESMEEGSPSMTGTTLSLGSSGTVTPKSRQAKWYNHKNQSQDTLAGLIEASAILSAPAAPGKKKSGLVRPGMGKRTSSAGIIEAAKNRISGRPRLEDEIRITVHIAQILSRQKYLLKLCRALMEYGAPTHRLEEYMKMSARVLEIEGQFLYIPGCMIISFDDASTHTTEVKLVKSIQGVNLYVYSSDLS